MQRWITSNEAHIDELDAEELETRVERQSAQEGRAEALW